MALKGLKKADQESKQQDIDDFISGASKRVKTLEKSQQKYRRLTFSLTEDVDKEIDDLLLNCRVARANRSIIIKAAIHNLKNLSESELQHFVLKELN
ncbi:hypothetical protein [Acinetobacter johnsonii]|jgi:hypothetical protein|uniref:hypothetical protein n=1 Tax=Acinetobacter johnsonii TaxID=40214 RepID=UPI003AF5C6BD